MHQMAMVLPDGCSSLAGQCTLPLRSYFLRIAPGAGKKAEGSTKFPRSQFDRASTGWIGPSLIHWRHLEAHRPQRIDCQCLGGRLHETLPGDLCSHLERSEPSRIHSEFFMDCNCSSMFHKFWVWLGIWGIQRPSWCLDLSFLSSFCSVAGRIRLLVGHSHVGVPLSWGGVPALGWVMCVKWHPREC